MGPSLARARRFRQQRIGEFKYYGRLHWDVMAITKVRFLAAARTGKNRIMIYGPRSDGTYSVEFETADGGGLAISCRLETTRGKAASGA